MLPSHNRNLILIDSQEGGRVTPVLEKHCPIMVLGPPRQTGVTLQMLCRGSREGRLINFMKSGSSTWTKDLRNQISQLERF